MMRRNRWMAGWVPLVCAWMALPAGAQNQPHKTVLRNGLVLITKEVHTSHVLAVNVFVRGGASVEPAERAGLAELTQRMLLRGTTRRTAEQVVAPIQAVGGSLQARADYDYSQLQTLSSADAFDVAIDTLADVVRNPRFDPQELEKERKQVLDVLVRLDDEAGWLTQRSLSSMLYPSGPYSRALPGAPASVKQITRDDLVRFHKTYYTPENLIVVVVGNIDRAAAEERVARAFGDMPVSGRDAVKPVAPTPGPLAGTACPVAVKEREAEVAHLVVGFPVAGVTREEYPALLVMSTLLGSGMGSRLMREVRERQGLGYDLGSYYSQFAGPSYLAAFIKTDPVRMVFGMDGPYPSTEMVINKAKDAILEQFDWVKQHPVPDAELVRARNFAIGAFLIDHQRTLSQARYLGWFELMGLGFQYDDELPRAIEKVTREDLQALARKYFTRYALALVVPEPK